MTDTVREKCLKALKARFTSINAEDEAAKASAADRYTIVWDKVTRSKLSDVDRRKPAVLGIYDTEEQEDKKLNFIYCSLRVIVEFYIYAGVNEDQSEKLNLVLGEVQRRIREDITLGGLALDVVSTGSELDIDGQYDRQVQGALYLNIKYRYRENDPRLAS